MARRRPARSSSRSRHGEARLDHHAFGGRLVSVGVERWGEHEREIVVHGPAVAIVAVDERLGPPSNDTKTVVGLRLYVRERGA